MDVLISNEIVSRRKLKRLVALAAAGTRVSVLVDNPDAVLLLAEVVASMRATSAAPSLAVHVLVECDVGHRRCGVPSAAAAVALGALVAVQPGLILDGIQAYHGNAQHVRSDAERAALSTAVAASAAAVRSAFLAAGLPCGVITGAGTGSFLHDIRAGVLTELQPGSYVLGDADYGRNLDPAGRPCRMAPFQPALYLLTQVRREEGEEEGRGSG
jgi:D-serine deaminase-like pyridoxal phosphate-dependent protein